MVIVADQVTKYLVTTSIPLHRGIEIIPGFANLVHARNPGAAFGIFADSTSNLRSLFLLLVSVAALVCIIWIVAASKQIDSYLLVGLSFFFGGATGNLVDRLRFGEVIDFVDVYVGSYHWPAFNVADASLCVGTAASLSPFSPAEGTRLECRLVVRTTCFQLCRLENDRQDASHSLRKDPRKTAVQRERGGSRWSPHSALFLNIKKFLTVVVANPRIIPQPHEVGSAHGEKA